MSLGAATDRRLIRFDGRSRRFVALTVRAPRAEESQTRPPANIGFVLDRSGSMNGEKFRLARAAVRQAVSALDRRDRFAVVVFDNQVDVVFELGAASPEGRGEALRRLDDVHPRGTTNLADGWLTGCAQIAERLGADRLARCLLLTDGLANTGMTDPTELSRHATELRKRGVSTSTFGVGSDFDEVLLGNLSDSGGGSFTFIEETSAIPALMARELGETLEVVARSVAVRVRHPPAVGIDVIGPYPVEVIPGGSQVVLPDLISGQELVFPIALRLLPGTRGETLTVEFALTDSRGRLDATPVPMAWTWAARDESEKQPRQRSVDRLVADRTAHQARAEAIRLQRAGQTEDAARHLRRVAESVGRHAGDDPELLRIHRVLKDDARRYRRKLDPVSLKTDFYESTITLGGGDLLSRSSRRRTIVPDDAP